MSVEMSLFYFFSSLALLSGVMVIRAKNPVHSVLFLILVFCNAAGLLILLDLDFFAMIFLVVYVGAIAVLFLFVVMMLNIKMSEVNENILRYLPVGGLIGIIFLFEIFLVIDNDLIPVLNFQTGTSLTLFETFQYSFLFFLYSIWGIVRSKISYDQWKIDYQEFQTDLSILSNYGTQFQYESSPYVQWVLQIDQVSNIKALGQIMYTYYVAYFIIASLILLVAMIGAIVLTMHKSITVKRQEIFEQNTREFAKTVQKIRLEESKN